MRSRWPAGRRFRGQVADNLAKAGPESLAVHASAGQHLFFNKTMQFVGDLQTVEGACGRETTLSNQ